MMDLLTAAQMRAIERAAIASGRVTGLELMERAGRGVVEAIFAEWPEFRAMSHSAVVLCGPGNNGGDGFVVARVLKGWGWEVEVFFYGDAENLPPDARVNYERWRAMGEVLDTLQNGNFDLIVDGLFGIGLNRPLPPDLVQAVDGLLDRTLLHSPNSTTKIVAIDIASGFCADSGRQIGRAAPYFAHLTVTFHRPKIGHYTGNYVDPAWPLRCVDIGLVGQSESVPLVSQVNLRLSKHSAHKYSHGHALIISGDHGRAGAARLAARGALRVGAGVVTLASPPAAMAENAARLDAIMLREGADGAALKAILEDRRVNALCFGPGMGTGVREAEMLRTALESGRRMVLDADALTLIAADDDLIGMLHQDCILTPHAGEFARVFPDLAEKLAAPPARGPAYSKVDATREAAARVGCVVLFKGCDTVIAGPSGRCAINSAAFDRAAPWLATAGSGDVLAGFITGLLARGFNPFDAACSAAWLHVECARSFGPGLIAEDLTEELPKVFRTLGV